MHLGIYLFKMSLLFLTINNWEKLTKKRVKMQKSVFNILYDLIFHCHSKQKIVRSLEIQNAGIYSNFHLFPHWSGI